MFKKVALFTRPIQARQDVPFPGAAAAVDNTAGVPLGYVEDVGEARTKLGKERVLARLGWVGGIVPFSASC
jgi:hypothetical protein